MKTIFIYHEVDAYYPIIFFTLDGDYSHLNNVYINETGNKALTSELTAILFNEDGSFKQERSESFPREVLGTEYKVIIVGFC